MIKECEKEKKSLLNKEDFLKIKEYLKKNYKSMEIIIEDTYFDTNKRYFKKNNSIMRLRKENEKKYLNYKEKQKDGSSIEEKLILDDKMYKEFIGGTYKKYLEKFSLDLEIEVIASYKILRTKFKIGENVIDLDNTKFSKSEDYEIEVESTNLKKAKDILLEILKENEIPYRKSSPKIARFFDEKEEEEFNFSFGDVILVVEGKSDYNLIRKLNKEVEIFITGGLGLDKDKIKELKEISQNHNKKIVVLTDPDVPGQIIRNKINNNIEDVYHIYVNKKLASGKKNIGIENMLLEDLENALSQKLFKDVRDKKKYSMKDLITIGIYNNKEKRMEFCNKHSISYGNNKKVLRQINNYGIDIFC